MRAKFARDFATSPDSAQIGGICAITSVHRALACEASAAIARS